MVYNKPRHSARPARPNPSISIDKAVAYIKWHANGLARFCEGTSHHRTLIEVDQKHDHQLEKAVRDCGWCIYFQRGDRGLHELAEAALKDYDETYRLDLKHMIEQAFSGVGNWLEHGDY